MQRLCHELVSLIVRWTRCCPIGLYLNIELASDIHQLQDPTVLKYQILENIHVFDHIFHLIVSHCKHIENTGKRRVER